MSGQDQDSLVATKQSLLIQSKAFHAPQPNIDLCCRILTALLFRFTQGDQFDAEEASNLFFACTKLFQSKDIFMRRLVYTLIRCLKPNPDDCIIVISCLSKDASNSAQTSSIPSYGGGNIGGGNNNGPQLNETCRANATRLLFYLVDDAMVQNIDRLLQQTLVDTYTATLTASLIASQHIYNYASDHIKKFKLEIQKSLDHNSSIIQYHALSLSYKTLQGDTMAATRFVSQQLKGMKMNKSVTTSKIPLSAILNLRVVSRMMDAAAKASPGDDIVFNVEWLECLRDALADSNNIAVQVESCKIILKQLIFTSQPQYIKLLQYTVGIMINILTKPSSTIIHKFATIRLLNNIAQHRTSLLTPHAEIFDGLLHPSFGASSGGNLILQNKELTMIAINIALKAGNDKNIDLFLTSLENVVSGVADDNKINVIFNIRDYLLHKNNAKYIPIISFLHIILKDENRYLVKNAVITCFDHIMATIPQAIPIILDYLAEHVEDCEYSRITIRVINLIGKYAYLHPSHPEKYIRYIFNRALLEASNIRAASVGAAVRIGLSLYAQHNKTNPNILISIRKALFPLLLSMCCDQDDEVRDRARIYLDLLLNLGFNHSYRNLSLLPPKNDECNISGTSNISTPTSPKHTKCDINAPNEFSTSLQFPPTTIPHDVILAQQESGPNSEVLNPANDLPSLDILEASLLNYLHVNHNVNTISRSSTTFSREQFQQQMHLSQQATQQQVSEFNENYIDSSLPVFNYSDFLKQFNKDGSTAQSGTSQGNDKPGQAVSAGLQSPGAGMSNDPETIISNLSQRLPPNTAAYLNSQQCGNVWQAYVDQSGLFDSQPGATPSTEFSSTINQYVYHNGVVVFETIVKNNFADSNISKLQLISPELIRLHQQGHIQMSQLSDHSQVPLAASPSHAQPLALKCGETISLFTAFKIKTVNSLLNLCSMKYTMKVQYVLEFDGDVDSGEYELMRLSVKPTTFIKPITHPSIASLPAQFHPQNIDFRTVWESLAQPQNNNANEVTCSFSVSLQSSSPQQMQQEYLTSYKQHINTVLQHLAKHVNLKPLGEIPSPSSTATPQCLINLMGVYLYEPQPQFICCRFGSILQPHNNVIMSKVIIKSHHPILTKLLAQIVEELKL